MRPKLTSKASVQGGLFTRAQALAAGYTERELKSLTRPGGSLRVVRHGIYAAGAFVESLDVTQRWLLMDRAALMVSQRPVVASHDSAARILRIPTLEVDEPASHLTSVGKVGARRSGGITRHRDMLPLCVELRDGLESTSYARTAIDIGRLHGFRHGLVATDAVRHLGVPLRDLEAELDRMENHPFIARARAAVQASAPGVESVAETLGRELVEELDLGEIETQFAVGISDGRVVWCDMRVGCHLIEVDGKVKLRSVADGGYATRTAEEVVWEEKTRQTLVCAEGLGMSRLVWADFFGERRERAKARLRAEEAVTRERFGPTLPAHLRRFADQHPRRTTSGLWTPAALNAAG
jgi:hypothetical protein